VKRRNRADRTGRGRTHLVVGRAGGGDGGARAAPRAAYERARVALREAELGEELVLLLREGPHGAGGVGRFRTMRGGGGDREGSGRQGSRGVVK